MTPLEFVNYFGSNFRTIETKKYVVTKKELLAIRNEYHFNGNFRLFLCGGLWDIKSKSIGLGQYQIWLEPAEV